MLSNWTRIRFPKMDPEAHLRIQFGNNAKFWITVFEMCSWHYLTGFGEERIPLLTFQIFPTNEDAVASNFCRLSNKKINNLQSGNY